MRRNVNPCHIISSVGDGNVTSDAVGVGVPVNVTENESARALGALTATTITASIIHNDFRITPLRLKGCPGGWGRMRKVSVAVEDCKYKIRIESTGPGANDCRMYANP